MNAKIRLVKCPRCHRVLPELSNVPVYQCGGCFAVLQVKKRKNGTNETGLHIHEMELPQKKEVGSDSEGRETQLEAHKGELRVEEISETVHKEAKVSDAQSEDMDCFSSGRESFVAAMGEAEADVDNLLLRHINRNGLDGKHSEGTYSSDDFDSSTEFGHNHSEEENNLVVEENTVNEVSPLFEPNHHQSEESSPVDDEAQGEVAEKKNSLEKNNGSNQIESGECDTEFSVTQFSNLASASNELTCEENENLSLEAERSSTEFDQEAISQFIFGNLTKKNLLAVDSGDSVITPRRSTINNDLKSPRAEQLEQSLMKVASGFDRMSSEETSENIDLTNGRGQTGSDDCDKEAILNQKSSNQASSTSSELICQELKDSSTESGTNAELKGDSLSRFIFRSFKKEDPLVVNPQDSVNTSQTLSSESNLKDNLPSAHDPESSEETLEITAVANLVPKYRSIYGYDGSVSSYGETDNRDSDKYLLPLEGKYMEAEPSRMKALPRRNEVRRKIKGGYPDSISAEKKPRTTKGFYSRQDQYNEPMGHEHLSGVPFRSRVSPIGYENGSTSTNLPPKPENHEEMSTKLQRLVCELQDQLDRTHIPQGHGSGGLGHIPPRYPISNSQVEICHDVSRNRLPRRCYQREGYVNQCHNSRIPFSSDAAMCRPRTEHFCFCGHSHDWHCSAPLSPHTYYKPSQYIHHPNPNHYTTHCLCSSNPHYCAGSEFSLGNHDLIYADHVGKHHRENFSRERNYEGNKHVLPVKGGAPFVVCYHCSNLLQLPTDFLLFRKRCHQLRCSACSFILKFSLLNGNHLERYTDDEPDILAPAPPPSEVDDHNDSNKGKKLAAVSYGGNCPHIDPVSYSDDYGPSICKSCSTEGEPLSPFDAHERVRNGKKTSAEHMKGKKSQPVLSESHNNCKNRISKAEKSSQVVVDAPRRDVSPLHRLMGYNSAREVLNR